MRMPDKIHILPATLANKIAAGEVIQRPASAVKELLENSIDAGAATLTVVVKDAGKQLIQVIDDGEGMGADDARRAFERHATSKIASYEDLLDVRTLGFRGEALASIGAIAHVELKTRRRGDEAGTRVRIEGGDVVEVSPAAAPVGTSIALKNLFYNTPARRKFLKTDSTEFKHIFDVVQRVAMAHPELEIVFKSDDETILHLRPAAPDVRIAELFGEKLASGLFSMLLRQEPLVLSGFLGRPQFARRSRIEQYLFLNKRPIVNRSIQHAVFQAYEHLLEKGSFPFYVLFLEVDPRKVDVNVHPAKSEVKFEDESGMYRTILSSVRKALSDENLVPALGLRQDGGAAAADGLRFRPEAPQGGSRAKSWESLFRSPDGEHAAAPQGASSPSTIARGVDRVMEPRLDDGAGAAYAGGQDLGGEAAEKAPIWQLHQKYIILSTDEGLMVIDQHAAHERVLYERAVGKFAAAHNRSQQLLFPHTLECSAGDAALIGQLIPDLESIGFSVRLFGKNAVIIDGVPLDVKPGEEGGILPKILDLYKDDDQSLQLQPREKLAKSYSCKAAIKAGDPLSEPEMRSLVGQLFQAEIPFVCPHGRPVMVTLSLAELDRRFGRTS